MTPFQEFRLWARRAPAGERLAAAVTGLVALTLLVWILVPASKNTANALPGFNTPNPSASNGTVPGGTPGSTTPGGTTPGGNSGTGPGGTAPGVGPGGTSTTGLNGTNPGSTNNGSNPVPAGCPSSSAEGVSASTIKIAAILVNIAGPAADSYFGVLPPGDQKAYWTDAANDLNAHGGVACRKVALQFFNANPADQNSLQQTCLDIVASKPFAVWDPGGYAAFPEVSCFATHHMPYFGGYLLQGGQQRQYYPYLFNFNTQETLFHDAVFGLKQKGYLQNTASFKLGFIYRTCNPHLHTEVSGWLNQAGVPSSKIVTYDVGCPSAFASPSTLQAAILRFQRAHVNHLIWADFVGDTANFTNIAQQQNFRPKYILADESLITTSYGNEHANYQNINGAIAITASRDAEERTPGMTQSAGSKRCSSIIKHNVWTVAAAAGNICDQVWMFQAAVAHAPVLQQNALAAGLQAAKSIDFSYPQGPNDFTANGVTYGGQYWRTATFTTSCNCWKLLETSFHRTFS